MSSNFSFNSLPLEIKIYIVLLAKLQDANYARRLRSNLSVNILKENLWRGKSLNALFCVSKELNHLASAHIFNVRMSSKVLNDEANIPYLFQTIQSVQIIPTKSLPLFRHIILPRRSIYVTFAYFNSHRV